MHNKLSVYSVYSAYLLNDSKLKSCRCLSFTLLRCMRCSMSTCICIQQPVHIVTLQIWENTIRVASRRVVDASGKIRFNFICILITSVIKVSPKSSTSHICSSFSSDLWKEKYSMLLRCKQIASIMKQHESDEDMNIKCDNNTLNCDITY